MSSSRSETVDILLSRWEKNNVIYCHWKSINHLKEALSGETDLDIIVSTENAVKAEIVALSSGFVKMETEYLRKYPGVHDYVAYDSNRNLFIHLHLHYQFVLGDRWVKAFRLPLESQVLKRRVFSDEFSTWVVSPGDELLLFCTRMSIKYKNSFTKKNIIREAKYLVQRCDDEKSISDLKSDYPAAVSVLALELLNKNCAKISRSFVKKVRKSMAIYRRMSLVKFRMLSNIRFFYRLIIEFNRRKRNIFSFGRRTLPFGGLVVAFVGMDGSGKTSAIARNTQFFAKQMDVSSVFIGSGRSGAPWYRCLIFYIMGSKAKLKSHKQVGTEKKYPPYYLLWVALFLSDRIKRIRELFKMKSSGQLVFVDRWPQDKISGSLDGPRLQRLNQKSILFNRIKKMEMESIKLSKMFYPDLVLRFIISPENSIMRKPGELTLEQANQAFKDLIEIKWPAESMVLDIDADRPIEEVDIQVRKAIWSKINQSI